MSTPASDAYTTRDTILTMLTDDEVARVSNAECASSLKDGDEYLDLEALPTGVQRAAGKTAVMGHVLPRKAIHTTTWIKILSHLATQQQRNHA
jgi:hypothetical protein